MNVLYPLALNFPDSHPIFRKTPADCGDNVENHSLFRKQNKCSPEKFPAQEEERTVWASAVALDRLVTLTKTHQQTNTPNTHTLSPLIGAWFMFGFFAEFSLEVGFSTSHETTGPHC